jgi:hypothetical protein
MRTIIETTTIRLATCFCFLLLSAVAPVSAGLISDLKADWSNITFHPGDWTYGLASNGLVFVPDWDGSEFSHAQGAWAFDANGVLPVYLRSAGAFSGVGAATSDWQLGDIVSHTGNGTVLIQWTSPITGSVDLSVGFWNGRNIGRSNDWEVRRSVDSDILASGNLSSGDGHTRAAPASFLGTYSVTVGDVYYLQLDPHPGSSGDFVGINFTVTDAAAPEPGTAMICLSGLMYLIVARKKLYAISCVPDRLSRLASKPSQ